MSPPMSGSLRPMVNENSMEPDHAARDLGLMNGGTPPTSRARQSENGLSSAEVQARRLTFGKNVVESTSRRGWFNVLRNVLREPMFLLLLAASGIYFLVGDASEALTLLAFVIAIVLLTVVQSHRTARVLDSLRDLSAPRAQVLRDGKRQLVSAAELVPGDVVFVDEGARVPADGTVTEAHELTVDESLLTGESVAVSKAPPPDHYDNRDSSTMLFFGSMVVQGQGRMVVTATGLDTTLGRIGKSLSTISEALSPLQLETRALINRFALAAVALCLLVLAIYRWRSGQWVPGMLAAIALAMGILPEEIPVILTVFMALGARRIANEGVLTRRMSAIETLGQTSVLCVDKTGTLTRNRMSVHAVFARGRLQAVGHASEAIDEAFHELIEYLVLASEIEPVDPMEIAFHEAGHAWLVGSGLLHKEWSLVQEYALTPELPAMSHAWHEPGRTDSAVACKGAPEAVCTLCRLSEQERAAVLDQTAEMASSGLRVLAVAKARHSLAAWPRKQQDFDFSFVGLVGLLDPVRPEVPAAITQCREAGIRVVMITGDYPSTAQAIAAEVGIGDGKLLTGKDIAAMDDARLRDALINVNVFARVTPEQKLRLVEAFRETGHVVAMTGDGVNDAPALKAAHIGIAMGLRGAEVAREVASLVLLRDDFSPIVSAIRMGRRIYGNLVQAISYTVAVHIPMIAATLIPAIAGWPPMLAPVHIVFLQLIIDPVCSVVFENEPERQNLMHVPPRPIGARLLSRRALGGAAAAGAIFSVPVLGLYISLLTHSYPQSVARTLAFVSLVTGNLALIFVIRRMSVSRRDAGAPVGNGYLWVVVAATGTALAIMLSVPAVAKLFELVALLNP